MPVEGSESRRPKSRVEHGYHLYTQRKGFVYLVAILDWFSRYVVSWKVSTSMEVEFCLEALEMAFEIDTPMIFNSDQGSQFTSMDFASRTPAEPISVSPGIV